MHAASRVGGSGSAGRHAYSLLYGAGECGPKGVSPNGGTVYDGSKYFNYLIGYNSRLDELQAAVLSVKLKYIDGWNEKRRETAGYYSARLDGSALVTPKTIESSQSVYHMYVLQSDNRDSVTHFLKQKGIATGIYYPVPLHLQKAYVDLGHKRGDLPASEYLAGRTFAIPVYPELTAEQREYIADTLLEAANNL